MKTHFNKGNNIRIIANSQITQYKAWNSNTSRRIIVKSVKHSLASWNLLNWAEGLNVETVVAQWGCWRVMWRWGCRLGKGRSDTHALCPPGSHAKRDRSDAAPGRHADELMKRYAVLLDGFAVWRVWGECIPAINHPGWSWEPMLPDQPSGGRHGAKATLKALGVPSLSMRRLGWSQRRAAEGITTRRCGAE